MRPIRTSTGSEPGSTEVGAITEDQAAIDQARIDFGGYGEAAGAFFESLSGGVIESATVQSGLGVHIDTLGQAIESLAAVYRG